MALYAIGDTHLSLGADKPMDVFGGGWSGYVDKLRAGFAEIGPEDTVVLCGDLSWGMSLEQAREDCLPGRIARTEDSAEGEPRLLVDHRRQNGTLFCRKRFLHPGDSPQQLPPVWRCGSVRDPGLVL